MTNMKFLIILILVLINEVCCLNKRKPLEPCERNFVVVVDGGSSGTRLHFFGFKRINKFMKLDVTDKMSSKIALSKFSKAREDWGLMRIMFHNLTSFAISKIPAQCLNNTPIYVQVTAGIRQLNQVISNKILNHVRTIFLKSKFIFEPEFVDILSTEKEGRLAWVSVNYLLGKFQNNKFLDTVGMLDLGGGSTQISFATVNASLIPMSKKMVIFEREYNVYSAGYDYMGINEIRIKHVNGSHCIGSKCQNKTLRTACLHRDVKINFNVGNRSLVMGGSSQQFSSTFNFCVEKAQKMVQHVKPVRKYFNQMEFVGISAFYHILKVVFNIQKIDEKDVMTYTMLEIMDKAKNVCNDLKNDTNNFVYFQCIDMTYIGVLLHNGYGFGPLDRISIAYKINKISLSWALGYAISIL